MHSWTVVLFWKFHGFFFKKNIPKFYERLSLFSFTNYFFFEKKKFCWKFQHLKNNIISVELAKVVVVGSNLYIFLEAKNWELKMKKWSVFLGGFFNHQNLKTKITRFLDLVAQNIYFCSQIWLNLPMDDCHFGYVTKLTPQKLTLVLCVEAPYTHSYSLGAKAPYTYSLSAKSPYAH